VNLFEWEVSILAVWGVAGSAHAIVPLALLIV